MKNNNQKAIFANAKVNDVLSYYQTRMLRTDTPAELASLLKMFRKSLRMWHADLMPAPAPRLRNSTQWSPDAQMSL